MDASSVLTHKKLIIVLYKNLQVLPIKIMVEPAGAFLVMGLLIACLKRGDKNESI